jgi:sortase A
MNKIRIIIGAMLVAIGLVVIVVFATGSLNAKTNVEDQKEAVTQLETQWATPTPSPAAVTPKAVDPALDKLEELPHGTVFATIRIPSLGAEWKKTIMQGTSPDILDTMEIGHYKSTENPGQLGNFALAGHNNTQGTVFDLVPDLKVGDEIIIETANAVYTYTFRSSEIVTPDKNSVLLPVPWKNGQAPTEAILTLTTCWPVDDWQQRWISYSVLKSAVAK